MRLPLVLFFWLTTMAALGSVWYSNTHMSWFQFQFMAAITLVAVVGGGLLIMPQKLKQF